MLRSLTSQVLQHPHLVPRALVDRLICRKDWSARLEQLVRHYLQNALAPSTYRTYSPAYCRYVQFCSRHHYPPFPLSEPILCQYAVMLASSKLKSQTIKSYLSGIRYFQIALGYKDPCIRRPDVLLGVCYKRHQDRRGQIPSYLPPHLLTNHPSNSEGAKEILGSRKDQG